VLTCGGATPGWAGVEDELAVAKRRVKNLGFKVEDLQKELAAAKQGGSAATAGALAGGSAARASVGGSSSADARVTEAEAAQAEAEAVAALRVRDSVSVITAARSQWPNRRWTGRDVLMCGGWGCTQNELRLQLSACEQAKLELSQQIATPSEAVVLQVSHLGTHSPTDSRHHPCRCHWPCRWYHGTDTPR
jgi:hypothetical protein